MLIQRQSQATTSKSVSRFAKGISDQQSSKVNRILKNDLKLQQRLGICFNGYKTDVDTGPWHEGF